MSYFDYALPAAVTFVIALSVFFKDTAAPKISVLNWAFIVVTGLLWPITLPFMVWKNLSALVNPAKRLDPVPKKAVDFELTRSYLIEGCWWN